MKFISRFEKIVVIILVIMMSFLIILTLFNVGFQFYKIAHNSATDIFDPDNLKKLFGMVLLVIVGLELLDTIKAYIKDDVVHAEVVILAAIIGLANKVIVLDLKQTDAGSIIALAGLMIALGITYYLLKEKLTLPVKRQFQEDADTVKKTETGNSAQHLTDKQ